MTITFFLKNHNDSVNLRNPDFNPTEPEDDIYNRRYVRDPIFPEINLSNSNAQLILSKLDFKFDHSGEIKNNQLDELVRKLTVKIEFLKLVKLDNYNEKYFYEAQYLLRIFREFEKLARYGLALNDDIVWC